MDIGKAEESLAATELCYAQGFYNAAVNRALLCHVSSRASRPGDRGIPPTRVEPCWPACDLCE